MSDARIIVLPLRLNSWHLVILRVDSKVFSQYSFVYSFYQTDQFFFLYLQIKEVHHFETKLRDVTCQNNTAVVIQLLFVLLLVLANGIQAFRARKLPSHFKVCLFYLKGTNFRGDYISRIFTKLTLFAKYNPSRKFSNSLDSRNIRVFAQKP